MKKIDPIMWKYGEWLERFLAGNHRYSDFLELANNALDILNIDYEIDIKSDTIFHFINKIDSKTPENQNIFDNWVDLICQEPIVEAYEAQSRNLGIPFSDEEAHLYLSPSVSISLISFSHRAESIRNVFEKLSKIEKPWEVAISELNQKKEKLLGGMADRLIEDYEGLTAAIVDDKGKLNKINKFALYPEESRLMFRWDTVTSRMLFDFLRLGGQGRYGFCERCENFMLVQRKGKKRFCDSLCRVYAHQEKSIHPHAH